MLPWRITSIDTPKILGEKMTEDKVLVKIEATLSKGPKDASF